VSAQEPPPSPAFSVTTRGYLIALSATLLLSFTGILISYLNRTYSLPSLVLAFWRALFVSLGMLGVLLVFRPALLRLERSNLSFMLFYGLTLALFNSTWTLSVQLNGAAVATVLAYSSPAFTAIFSRWLFSEKISPLKVVSIAFCLTGIVLVADAFNASAWNLNPFGILLGLISGLMYAGYSLFGRQAAIKKIDSWTTLFFTFSTATGFLFIFNAITNLVGGFGLLANFLWLGDSAQGWAVLLFLALGPTIGGFGLYVMSLGYLPATVVNLIAALEPVLTGVWAYLLFGERLGPLQLIGAALVLGGVILLRIKNQ